MRIGSVFKFAGALLLLITVTLPIQAKTSLTLDSGEVLHDPTKPADWRASRPAKAVARQYKLNYILNADGRKMAMINGQRVSVGDYVSGAKVLAISEGSVSLMVDGQRRTLRVSGATGIKIRK